MNGDNIWQPDMERVIPGTEICLDQNCAISGEDGEEDTELKYLIFLRDIRDNDKDLFEKIKRLPKKSRTARKYKDKPSSVLTFFRKGTLRKNYQGFSLNE